jgi:tRNA A37 threonylcarbamoyltransferase TsaD
MKAVMHTEYIDVDLAISSRQLATDNALMIALAAIPYVRNGAWADIATLKASGNVRLGT